MLSSFSSSVSFDLLFALVAGNLPLDGRFDSFLLLFGFEDKEEEEDEEDEELF